MRQRGLDHVADAYEERRWSERRSWFDGFAEIDSEAHERLLKDLANGPHKALTYQQTTRLDELADFCETLNLNDNATWPRIGGYDEWFWPMVNLVRVLGRFDASVLAAQAALILQRTEELTVKREPFFGLFDKATVRRLDAWSEVGDRDTGVALAVRVPIRMI